MLPTCLIQKSRNAQSLVILRIADTSQDWSHQPFDTQGHTRKHPEWPIFVSRPLQRDLCRGCLSLQLNHDYLPIRQQWPLHNLCNAKVLWKTQNLVTFSMTVTISWVMLEHSSPNRTNKRHTNVEPVLRHAVDKIPSLLAEIPSRVPSYRLLSPLHTDGGKSPA